jgi:hypothetical protein
LRFDAEPDPGGGNGVLARVFRIPGNFPQGRLVDPEQALIVTAHGQGHGLEPLIDGRLQCICLAAELQLRSERPRDDLLRLIDLCCDRTGTRGQGRGEALHSSRRLPDRTPAR